MATKILLVDDEPEVEGMIKLKYRREIRKGIYEFYFAQNGVEALEKLKDNDDIDIIISDINMPKMDGLTLLSHITELDRLLRAIIVSAYGDMENIRTAMNKGAYDFLTKPIDFEDLTATIEKTRKNIDQIKANLDALQEAEDSLQESTALNHAIITHAAETIITVNSEGKIESVNPAIKQMFGYHENEIIGENITRLIPEHFFEAKDRDSLGSAYEVLATKNDGSTFECELSVTELELRGKKMYNGMIRDITMRKKAEKLLKEYNQTLEKEVDERTKQLRKLNEEKNEILGVAAHDLKNPLSNIKMLAKIMLEDEGLDREEINEFTQDILTASERMFELITNLLDVNRIEQGRIDISPEAFSLATISEREMEIFIDAAEKKNIKLHFEIQKDADLDVWADQGKTMQVIDNLISNAVKYSPHDKNVYIKVENCEDEVVFSVKDEGPGISEEDQKKLFGKFARLSAQPTGGEHSTGLGLSIVKKLTQLMGGNVWCESKLGEGAKFLLSLPTVEKAKSENMIEISE